MMLRSARLGAEHVLRRGRSITTGLSYSAAICPCCTRGGSVTSTFGIANFQTSENTTCNALNVEPQVDSQRLRASFHFRYSPCASTLSLSFNPHLVLNRLATSRRVHSSRFIKLCYGVTETLPFEQFFQHTYRKVAFR